MSARHRRAAIRSTALFAATPASTSPERSGVAFAMTSFKSLNCQQWLAMVCR
jgi:hypothetical protein